MNTHPQIVPQEKYLTSREVADWLGISLRTVVNLRRRRVLPYIKLGRVVRFDRGQVSAAMKLHTVEGIRAPSVE